LCCSAGRWKSLIRWPERHIGAFAAIRTGT
jgi:hypothetical protein